MSIFMDYGNHLISNEEVSGPSTSWIYSHFRMAHHVNPFADKYTFIDWIPGIILLFGIFYANSQLSTKQDSAFNPLLGINRVALIFLLFSLFVTLIDSSGFLGPFNLFRPSSVVLFLFLCYLVTNLNDWTDNHKLTFSVLIITISLFLPTIVFDNATVWTENKNRQINQSAVLDFLGSNTDKDSVVLINPEFERDFLSFERKSQRPSYVSWKFITSDKVGISEWYQRINQRIAIFADPCEASTDLSVSYLLDVANSPRNTKTCLIEVFSDESYTLYKLAKR